MTNDLESILAEMTEDSMKRRLIEHYANINEAWDSAMCDLFDLTNGTVATTPETKAVELALSHLTKLRDEMRDLLIQQGWIKSYSGTGITPENDLPF